MYNVKVYSLGSEGGTKLSDHFRVREFACKDSSDPVFISQDLVDILEKIRVYFGAAVTVNSGYRTVSYNKTVSGSATASQHCNGLAADIKISGVSPKTIAAYAETLLPNTGGIGIYSTFVHIDVRKTKARWNG